MVPVFKNVGERSTAKSYRPVSLLSVISKVFEKLVNSRIVDHLNLAFFLIFSMVLGLLGQLQIFSVLSDRISRACNRSGATQAVALDISKAFDRVLHAGLHHKRKSY